MTWAIEHKAYSQRRACRLFRANRSTSRYRNIVSDATQEITELLMRLADSHKRWGFGLIFRWLRYNGYTWNHKKVYRIYRDLALNLRIKPKKTIACQKTCALASASLTQFILVYGFYV